MSSNILTVPNLLTFLRMALIPVFASFLYYGFTGTALIIFMIAGASDGIDGFLARRFNQESELGTILDPIADKLLMTTAFIVLLLPNIPDFVRVPVWVTAAVIGRDILIVAAAVAIFITTNFRGFKPSWLGKFSTLVQVSAVTLILVSAVSGITFYLKAIHLIVAVVAVLSGIHYIFHVASLMREADAQGKN